MDSLGYFGLVFSLGLNSTLYGPSLLSTLDAFWISHECDNDASHSGYSFLCRYSSIWDRVPITRKRSNASPMGSGVTLLSGKEPKNKCQPHGEAVLMLGGCP